MCGIAGYIGPLHIDHVLLTALERLKYRGYDSAGMAVHVGTAAATTIGLRRAAGTLEHLIVKVQHEPIRGLSGIAHTRWATHGPPTEANCHPHGAANGRIAVVHNGIIENHDALRRELQAGGVIFSSQTDTEVIPHLISSLYFGDPVAAVRSAITRLTGSFAFAVIFADHPGRIIAVRAGSPLLVGQGPEALMIASDLPALLPHATSVLHLDDGQLADLQAGSVAVTTFNGTPVTASFVTIELTADAVSKGDFDSFMAKEIAEQPMVLARVRDSRLQRIGSQTRLVMPELGVDLAAVQHVSFLACGTSWHAALLGKRFIEHLARVPVEVEVASEYRYRNPIPMPGGIAIAISQSGETADTLASLRLARQFGQSVIALVNVVTSTIARESHGVLPLFAGPEIGVASTKAYTAQVLALYLFSLQLAKANGRLSADAECAALAAIEALPQQVADTLAGCEAAVVEAAELFAPAEAAVFLGRLGEHPTALEGALKLKEIAYVHANGYPAGEFKHGPIALVTAHLPVICICPHDEAYEKMLSNLQEVKARHGRLLAVGHADDQHLAELCDLVFPVGRTHDRLLQPILTILPLQRYAYHVAKRRGCNVDQPRNLAKSVTVE